MERESVLNSFRLQFHSFFIFHLSLSRCVIKTHSSFRAFGTMEFIILLYFFLWDFDPLPFFFLSFSLCFPKFSLVVGSNTHRKQTFGLHNVVIALFEEERLFEEEEEEEEDEDDDEKRHNSFEFYYTHTHTYIYIYIAKRSAMSTASSSLKATAVAQHHQHQQQRVVVSSPQKRLRLSKKASSSLTSTAKRNVVRRRANAVSVRAQEGQKGEKWQSMNVSLPNLRDNLDRSTTRNIDGTVYTLELTPEDEPLVSDNFKQKYDARVNAAGVIEANVAGSVQTPAEMMSFGDINLALDITKITGMQKNVEVMNGRAAMVGITAALFAKIGTGQGVGEQLFSPAGIASVLFISLFTIAGSVAPAALNKVTMEECFPDENKVYENERLPVTWTATAEVVNGKVAMGVFLVALLTGQ